jgi:hypothetical protein
MDCYVRHAQPLTREAKKFLLIWAALVAFCLAVWAALVAFCLAVWG